MKPLRVLLALTAAGLSGCGQGKRNFTMKALLAKVRGPDERKLVVQMFESEDPDLRREAIEQLSRKDRFLRGKFLEGYAVLAGDPAPTVRSAAVRALGKGGDPKYFKQLAATLNDENAMVRWDAAVALDSVITTQAVLPLAQAALNDQNVDVRGASVRALRHYRRGDVLETLLRCMEDPQFAVRFRAGESLAELTGETGGTDPDLWRAILSKRPDLFAAPKPKRPWWDWFGVTQRKKSKPAPTPKPPPAEPPPKPAKARRPWWDWFGITKGKKAAPATRPAGGE